MQIPELYSYPDLEFLEIRLENIFLKALLDSDILLVNQHFYKKNSTPNSSKVSFTHVQPQKTVKFWTRFLISMDCRFLLYRERSWFNSDWRIYPQEIKWVPQSGKLTSAPDLCPRPLPWPLSQHIIKYWEYFIMLRNVCYDLKFKMHLWFFFPLTSSP